MVITMAKLRMAHASTHGARKPPGPIFCSQPLPDKIPGRSFSYSDHEAVTATLRVERDVTDTENITKDTIKNKELEKKDVLSTALAIVSDRLAQSYRDQIFFYVVAVLLVFVVLALSSSSDTSSWVSSIAVSICSIAATVYSLLAGVTTRKEQNALKAARQSILLLQAE